ncbi:MAG: UDP-N-acetylmuramoyl-L-alanyl-D-glutamate--2,6-diaminopimelate ligase [Tissierellia bacterium]|nr:UDP-N-acetylmuramoyl-L-alanyl-D-glutamate--2,6-diaminopimelate ligase [Tissierellia bacterium]
MKLQDLFTKLQIDPAFNYEVTSVETDSRKVGPTSIFVAIRGSHVDSHDQVYLEEAYEKGCRVFILEEEKTLPEDAVIFVVANTRKTLGLVASSLYGHPTKQLKIIGVTGTKGKTSTSFILKQLLEGCGMKTLLIGTSGIFMGKNHFESSNTTPDPLVIQKLLREAADGGVQYVIMEVSSQAMKQFRVFGCRFMASVFTNLSEDHIGPMEHENFQEYMQCKKHFLMLGKKVIANKDDPYFEEITSDLKKPILTVGHGDADFLVRDGEDFFLNQYPIETNLKGSFNRMNLSLALATLNEIGFSMERLLPHTKNLHIPGRLETYTWNNRTFVIDYAHNKMSLSSLLQEIETWNPKAIRLVVGSVGDRTFERRKEIPEAAAPYVDALYLTSDNPGMEDPQKILDEMKSHSTVEPTYTIVDRREAILKMAKESEEGEVLVISGKGDETYQLIGKERVPYSDASVVQYIQEHL